MLYKIDSPLPKWVERLDLLGFLQRYCLSLEESFAGFGLDLDSWLAGFFLARGRLD
jgi:hypothetical protein